MNSIFKLCLLAIFTCCLTACGNKNNQVKTHPAYQNPSVKPLTDAIEAQPDQAELYYNRAEALSQIRCDSLALIDVEKAISLDTANAQYTFTKGYLEIEMGKAAAAIKTLLYNLEQSPGNVSTRLLLSKAYLMNNNAKDAAQQLNTILQAAPDHIATHLMYAQLEMTTKDTAAAEKRLQLLLNQDKHNYEATYLLAELYAGKGLEKAVVLFNEAYALDTLNAEPLYDIGLFYEKMNSMEKAKEAFVFCLSKDNDYTDAYLKLGDYYFAEQDVLKALRHYNLAIQTAPNNAMAYYKKGICFEKMKQRDSAKLAFYQALVFDSRLKDAKAAFERVK